MYIINLKRWGCCPIPLVAVPLLAEISKKSTVVIEPKGKEALKLFTVRVAGSEMGRAVKIYRSNLSLLEESHAVFF